MDEYNSFGSIMVFILSTISFFVLIFAMYFFKWEVFLISCLVLYTIFEIIYIRKSRKSRASKSFYDFINDNCLLVVASLYCSLYTNFFAYVVDWIIKNWDAIIKELNAIIKDLTSPESIKCLSILGLIILGIGVWVALKYLLYKGLVKKPKRKYKKKKVKKK